jgi:hypothetical protein
MNTEQIADYLEPHCKEIFDAYLLVGFTVDEGKVAVVGDLGHPNAFAEFNRKLQPVYSECKKILREDEE